MKSCFDEISKIRRETPAGFCEFYRFYWNSCFEEHLWTATLYLPRKVAQLVFTC